MTIQFEVAELRAGRWEYIYEVTNIGLGATVEEFTVWFDVGLYENLAITTLDPPSGSWDELVVQPDSILGDGGFYDALSLTDGITIGETVTGFGVSFDWLATHDPGAQPFEIVDPTTFGTLYTGVTVPEPGTLFLLAAALSMCNRRRKSPRSDVRK